MNQYKGTYRKETKKNYIKLEFQNNNKKDVPTLSFPTITEIEKGFEEKSPIIKRKEKYNNKFVKLIKHDSIQTLRTSVNFYDHTDLKLNAKTIDNSTNIYSYLMYNESVKNYKKSNKNLEKIKKRPQKITNLSSQEKMKIVSNK